MRARGMLVLVWMHARQYGSNITAAVMKAASSTGSGTPRSYHIARVRTQGALVRCALMGLWGLALLVTLYVAMDVAYPLMPGALVFDPEASVEARQTARFWASDDVTPPMPGPARTELATRVPVSPGAAMATPRPPRRLIACARAPLRAPDSSGEDDAPSAALAR